MKYIKRFLVESCHYWLGASIYRRDVKATSQRWYYEPKPKWDWKNYEYMPSWSYLLGDE